MSNLSKVFQGLDSRCDGLRACLDAHITKKESQIMFLIANNFTVQQIAKYVCRSEKTIYKHIENSKRKLSCKSQAALAQQIATYLEELC